MPRTDRAGRGNVRLRHYATTGRRTLPETGRVHFACPLCGRADADITPRDDGRGYWVGCWSCQAHLGMGEYIRQLAEAVGDVSAGNLLDDPHHYLAPHITGELHRRPPARLPSDATITGRQARLQSDSEALGWLHRRGLTDETIRRYRFGRVEAGVYIPIYGKRGQIVTGVVYNPHRKRKYDNTAGRRARLFPAACESTLLLGAGLLDAPRVRQEGLPCVTTTCGMRVPEPLRRLLAHRADRVAVVFDIGEEPQTERVAEQLRELGVRAWPVALPMPDRGADLTDWFQSGRTRRELCAAISRACPRRWR